MLRGRWSNKAVEGGSLVLARTQENKVHIDPISLVQNGEILRHSLGTLNAAIYSASKAGVRGLTQAVGELS